MGTYPRLAHLQPVEEGGMGRARESMLHRWMRRGKEVVEGEGGGEGVVGHKKKALIFLSKKA